MIILFKYYADMENCKSSRGFDFIYMLVTHTYVWKYLKIYNNMYNIIPIYIYIYIKFKCY